MKSSILLVINFIVFNYSTLAQSDTSFENNIHPVIEDNCIFTVIHKKLISDSVVPPKLINKYKLSETIAREMLFTNEYDLEGSFFIGFSLDFTISKDGTVEKGSYKSELQYQGKDYSILCQESLQSKLKLWKPAVLIGNKNVPVDYQ
jgi:hypothetical protein